MKAAQKVNSLPLPFIKLPRKQKDGVKRAQEELNGLLTTMAHDISDAAGEITNMVSGFARKILESGCIC